MAEGPPSCPAMQVGRPMVPPLLLLDLSFTHRAGGQDLEVPRVSEGKGLLEVTGKGMAP